MLAPALFAKIASAGLAAKAATVAGVAVVGFSTAGFVGALPVPAQHTFATVVDHATPFTAPDPTASDGTDGTDGTTTGDQTPAAGDTTTPATETPATPTPFGQQVSQMAHEGHDGHPGVDGQAVSSMAHARHSAADQTGDGTDQTSADDGSQDTQPSTDGDASGHGKSGTAGHGHG